MEDVTEVGAEVADTGRGGIMKVENAAKAIF